jgi:hypothetical protein
MEEYVIAIMGEVGRTILVTTTNTTAMSSVFDLIILLNPPSVVQLTCSFQHCIPLEEFW